MAPLARLELDQSRWLSAEGPENSTPPWRLVSSVLSCQVCVRRCMVSIRMVSTTMATRSCQISRSYLITDTINHNLSTSHHAFHRRLHLILSNYALHVHQSVLGIQFRDPSPHKLHLHIPTQQRPERTLTSGPKCPQHIRKHHTPKTRHQRRAILPPIRR